MTAADSAPVARLLSLGDSYTIGEAVAAADRWPDQLAALLRADDVRMAEPTIIAKTGWTTDELACAIEAASPSEGFDVVTLQIGVNNQYRGRSVDEFRDELRALLGSAIRLAGGRTSRVVVLSIPDWGVTPFAEGRDRARIAAGIDQFNSVTREEVDRAGAHYIDVTPISRKAAADSALLASDGLHPSRVMYAEWARLARPVVRSLLKRP